MAVWVFYDYGKYFLHSMFPAEASCLDLELWKDNQHFKEGDPTLVESVGLLIKGHMWYDSEELTPMALADPDLDNTTKDAIADAMLANLSGPQRFAPQEPVMDTEVPEKPLLRCL